MNSKQKHELKVSRLISKLVSDSDRAELVKYAYTVRKSRMDWNDKHRLRAQINQAIQAYDDRLKPKLTVIQGAALISRRSNALLVAV